MKAITMMKKAPIDWKKSVDRMTSVNKRELAIELENVASVAAMQAEYLNERYGYGCGDQGHEKAEKSANKAGRAIWRKVFGYNAHHDIRF